MSTPEYYDRVGNTIMIDGIHTSYIGGKPAGRYLLAGNQKSNEIAVFRVDVRTGQLALTGTYQVPSPVSFVFVPEK